MEKSERVGHWLWMGIMGKSNIPTLRFLGRIPFGNYARSLITNNWRNLCISIHLLFTHLHIHPVTFSLGRCVATEPCWGWWHLGELCSYMNSKLFPAFPAVWLQPAPLRGRAHTHSHTHARIRIKLTMMNKDKFKCESFVLWWALAPHGRGKMFKTTDLVSTFNVKNGKSMGLQNKFQIWMGSCSPIILCSCASDHPESLPECSNSHPHGQFPSDPWCWHPSDRKQLPNSRAAHCYADAPRAHHCHTHAPTQGAQSAKFGPNPRTAVQRTPQHLPAEWEEPHCP